MPEELPTLQVPLVALHAAPPAVRSISWGKHVSPAFKAGVLWIEQKLGLSADNLMDCMCFETGGTFSAKARNKQSTATGLIQFMRATLDAMLIRYPNLAKLASNMSELAALQDEVQLTFVYYYFKEYADRGYVLGSWSLEDTYMAILLPSMIGMPLDQKMRWSSNAYAVNRGLDIDRNGVITKREATTYVRQRAVEGRRKENFG